MVAGAGGVLALSIAFRNRGGAGAEEGVASGADVRLAGSIESRDLSARPSALPTEVYLWQRDRTPAVQESLAQASRRDMSVVVLAAEIDITKRKVARFDLSFLKGRSAGLAVRVGPTKASDYLTGSEATRLLAETVQTVMKEARSVGVTVTELQIDHDAAESKLISYREWVSLVRESIGNSVPVVITALPSWIKAGGFRDLASAANGVVMQVHSLRKPRDIGDDGAVFDRGAAELAVTQMARLGIPFRVALPTYGYTVGFGSNGQKLLGLSAEGPNVDWGNDAAVGVIRARSRDVSQLVEWLKVKKPKEMSGVIFYRLPVTGDRLNWGWQEFDAVRIGREPRASVEVIAQPEGDVVDVVMINRGDGEAEGEVTVEIVGKLEAFDTLVNVEQLTTKAGDRTEWVVKADRLQPGEKRILGWVRGRQVAVRLK